MIEDKVLQKWARLFSILPDLQRDLGALAEQVDALDADVVEGMILDKIANFMLEQQRQLLDQRDRIETMGMVNANLMQELFRLKEA